MVTINLRDFYPWYMQDEFIEVVDEIADELFADNRYERAHTRRVKRNKAQYSLDAEDGIETAAIVYPFNSPEAVFDMMGRFCRLCRALNSLPEIQGRRIEAHYILCMSQRDIAKIEGVSENAINKSIKKGLVSMKKFLN